MEECMPSWPVSTLLLFAGLSVTIFVAFSGFYSTLKLSRKETTKPVAYILGTFDEWLPGRIFLFFFAIILAFLYIWTFGLYKSVVGFDIQYFKIYSAGAITFGWCTVFISLIARFLRIFEGKTNINPVINREDKDYFRYIS